MLDIKEETHVLGSWNSKRTTVNLQPRSSQEFFCHTTGDFWLSESEKGSCVGTWYCKTEYGTTFCFPGAQFDSQCPSFLLVQAKAMPADECFVGGTLYYTHGNIKIGSTTSCPCETRTILNLVLSTLHKAHKPYYIFNPRKCEVRVLKSRQYRGKHFDYVSRCLLCVCTVPLWPYSMHKSC